MKFIKEVHNAEAIPSPALSWRSPPLSSRIDDELKFAAMFFYVYLMYLIFFVSNRKP